VPIFTLARIMGTSVRMIERHYGALLDDQLDALDTEPTRPPRRPTDVCERSSAR
jgi:hypothetical protein